MKANRLPNVTELGRRPDKVRFMWVFQLRDGSIKSGATWMTLRSAHNETPRKDVKSVNFIDLIQKEVQEIHYDNIPLLMQAWRENYFDPKWCGYSN